MNNKIFLIGFMGSGKSTLGKKLSKKLNKTFFDLDIEIEKEEGSTIDKIFLSKGEDYFREIEQEVLTKIILNKKKFVMALGGGTPCFYNNIELINQVGTSIYIKYNTGLLTSRLLNTKIDRPLIKGKSEEELISFIEQTLLEREIFYIQSKFIIEKNNIKVKDLLNCC